MSNTSLNVAKNVKNDEFYTRIEDIDEEINHYESRFYNKIVLCNCDTEHSNFYKYFHLNFKRLGLKKIIATHYEPDKLQSYKIEYLGGNDENLKDGIKINLKQNGDFFSDECIELLNTADIIVTNPPFSLFREYLNMLIEYNKYFLIIGNINAITYKEIFPLLMNNTIWLGCRSLNKDMYFYIPEERKDWLIKNKKEGSAYKIVNGTVMGRLASACWYTNLDHEQRHKIFNTEYTYSTQSYLKYDNYDAIHIDKINEIPMDYKGIMGVPITFMGKLNPSQFKLVGLFNHGSDGYWDLAKPIINGKERFKRIAICKK